MAENLLVLYPAVHDAVPHDLAALARRLGEIGFIGAPLEYEGREHFRPGDEFLQLLTFLGCSPVVALGEPGATGDEFCHIQLDVVHPGVRFLRGSNVKVPRCPSCGYRIEDWGALAESWTEQPLQSWTCPHCGKQHPIPQLRWRQCAGFGRFFIYVWGIFEGEAVPSDDLLAALHDSTGVDWRYFYLQK